MSTSVFWFVCFSVDMPCLTDFLSSLFVRLLTCLLSGWWACKFMRRMSLLEVRVTTWVVDWPLSLQDGSNVTLEAVIDECCPAGCGFSLNLLILIVFLWWCCIAVPSCQRSLYARRLHSSVHRFLPSLCFEDANLQTLIFTFSSCSSCCSPCVWVDAKATEIVCHDFDVNVFNPVLENRSVLS